MTLFYFFSAVAVVASLLVIAQRPSEADKLPLTGQWALLGAALLLGVIAFLARAHIAAALCGLLAGFGFGIAAVGSRIVSRVDVLSVFDRTDADIH